MKKGIDYVGVGICYICHDGEGNFLMALRGQGCRDEHMKWDTGGGALDHGERVEECLKREIREEYLTEVLDLEFLGVRDVHRQTDEGIKTHWVALDYKVLIDKKQVGNGEPHKFDALDWFNMQTLPANLHSQLPTFFDRYRHRL